MVRYPASKQGAYTIPNGVTSIGDNAFYDCTGLLTITIPESITSIESEAFKNCRPFYAMFILNPSPPVLGEYAFGYLPGENFCLHVPESGIEAYREAEDEYVSVAAIDRVIPAANPVNETAVIAPVNKLTAEFAAGPNPASKSSGAVNFYYRGNRVKSGALTVYDASGSAVKKITIRDAAAIVGSGKRAVGSWNLTDAKGRPAPAGTYLVRGTFTASNGRSERVSAAVGVR